MPSVAVSSRRQGRPKRVDQHRSATLRRSHSNAYPVSPQLGRLRRDVDPVQTGGVLAQDLPLDLEGQIHVVLLFQVLWQLECHKLLDPLPIRRCPAFNTIPPSRGGTLIGDGTIMIVSPVPDACWTWAKVLNGAVALPSPPAAAVALTYHL
jgi:hypothetical protein